MRWVRVDSGVLASLKHICAVLKPSNHCLQNPLSESALDFHLPFCFKMVRRWASLVGYVSVIISLFCDCSSLSVSFQGHAMIVELYPQ